MCFIRLCVYVLFVNICDSFYFLLSPYVVVHPDAGKSWNTGYSWDSGYSFNAGY